VSREPPRGAVPGAMVVAVVAISSSAILARLAMGDDPGVARAGAPGAASALAIAFWRCALGAAALGPAAWRRRRPLTATRRRQLVGSGLALGAHFALFQGALALTTVASAVTLATMSPIFVALGAARFLHEPASRRVLIGLGVTVAGALLIGAGDLRAIDLGPRALLGDAMALASAVAVTGYLLVGRVARRDVAASTYSASVYAVAAAALLVVCLAAQVPLWGFSAATWAAIGGIVVGPQLLGHTIFNTLLSRVSATVVAVVVLSEPVGAAVLAWLLLTETPTAAFAVGAPLVLAGVALATGGRATRPAAPDAPVATSTPDR
jgi:drug/metabolite transporter (DMT)-like permease